MNFESVMDVEMCMQSKYGNENIYTTPPKKRKRSFTEGFSEGFPEGFESNCSRGVKRGISFLHKLPEELVLNIMAMLPHYEDARIVNSLSGYEYIEGSLTNAAMPRLMRATLINRNLALADKNLVLDKVIRTLWVDMYDLLMDGFERFFESDDLEDSKWDLEDWFHFMSLDINCSDVDMSLIKSFIIDNRYALLEFATESRDLECIEDVFEEWVNTEVSEYHNKFSDVCNLCYDRVDCGDSWLNTRVMRKSSRMKYKSKEQLFDIIKSYNKELCGIYSMKGVYKLKGLDF